MKIMESLSAIVMGVSFGVVAFHPAIGTALFLFSVALAYAGRTD